jgi:hypothetical protein
MTCYEVYSNNPSQGGYCAIPDGQACVAEYSSNPIAYSPCKWQYVYNATSETGTYVTSKCVNNVCAAPNAAACTIGAGCQSGLCASSGMCVAVGVSGTKCASV